jgi:hypothetical protein
MTSFWLLVVVAALVAVVALAGFRPKGTRPVAKTGLMTVARIVLIALALLLAYAASQR